MRGDWRLGQSIERALGMQDSMAADGAPVGTTRKAADMTSLAEGRIAGEDLLANTAAANMEAMRLRRGILPATAAAPQPRAGKLVPGTSTGSLIWQSTETPTAGTPAAADSRIKLLSGPTNESAASGPVADRNRARVDARDASLAAAADIEKSLVTPPGAAPVTMAPATDRAALIRGDTTLAAKQDRNFAQLAIEAEKQGTPLKAADREGLRTAGGLDKPAEFAAPAPAPAAADPNTAAGRLALFDQENPNVLTGEMGDFQIAGLRAERAMKPSTGYVPVPASELVHTPATDYEAAYRAMPKPVAEGIDAAAAAAAAREKEAAAAAANLQADKAEQDQYRSLPERVYDSVGGAIHGIATKINAANAVAGPELGALSTAVGEVAGGYRDAAHDWLMGKDRPIGDPRYVPSTQELTPNERGIKEREDAAAAAAKVAADTAALPTPAQQQATRASNAAVGLYKNQKRATPSNPFGGARAEGGPVEKDKAYLVGEKGPELVIPEPMTNAEFAQLKSNYEEGIKTAEGRARAERIRAELIRNGKANAKAPEGLESDVAQAHEAKSQVYTQRAQRAADQLKGESEARKQLLSAVDKQLENYPGAVIGLARAGNKLVNGLVGLVGGDTRERKIAGENMDRNAGASGRAVGHVYDTAMNLHPAAGAIATLGDIGDAGGVRGAVPSIAGDLAGAALVQKMKVLKAFKDAPAAVVDLARPYLRAAVNSLVEKNTPIPARASGGPVSADKPYLVGEEGPELVVPKQDAVVIPNQVMNRLDVLAGPDRRRKQNLLREQYRLTPVSGIASARG
jgi:hypothetical protein